VTARAALPALRGRAPLFRNALLALCAGSLAACLGLGGKAVRRAPDALQGLSVAVTCTSPAAWKEPFAEKEVCDATQDALLEAGFAPSFDHGKADLSLALLVSFHGDQVESTVAHAKEPALDVARFDRKTCGSMATGGKTAKCLAAAIVNDLVESRRAASWASSRTPVQVVRSAPIKAALAVQGRLAVLELRSKLKGRDAESFDTGYFADLARGAALRALPSMQVITKENLLVLLEAQGKTIESCEGECEVDTGRMVGADYVVSGEALRVGSHFKINLKLHETKSARLVSQGVASGRTVDELDGETQRAVTLLVQALR
jgi:hypothetical protein